MCRRNLALAAALIAFGTGLLVGLFIESCLAVLIIAAASIAGGFFLLKMI